MKLVIEDYTDALVAIQALRQYACTFGSAEIPDVEARRLRVHKHLGEAQNGLFAIHSDLVLAD